MLKENREERVKGGRYLMTHFFVDYFCNMFEGKKRFKIVGAVDSRTVPGVAGVKFSGLFSNLRR